MTNLLKPIDVANCVTALVSRNKLWANKDVHLFLISNEIAGCFKDLKKAEKYKKIFNKAEESIKNIPTCVKSIKTKLFTTEYAGHAKDLALAITAELIALKEPDSEYILATAGGDGTSLEVQTTLFNAAHEVPQKCKVIMNQITILRLPLGTGNDGTDGHTVEELIDLLRGPLMFKNARAIKVSPEGNPTAEQIVATGRNPKEYNPDYKAPWLAFNIASIGLDAYICHMTNVIKSKIPGNFYHKVIDLCGLVYDKKFPPASATFEYFDENGMKIKEVKTAFEMFDMGPTGNRLIGGGHKMLPDDNNCCLTFKINLLQLIMSSKYYVDGRHAKKSWLASLDTAHKVRITYDRPLLVQCDGEVFLLCKEHFPIVIEKTEPCLRILQKAK